MGYSLPDFQLIWSNFLNHFTSLHFTSLQFNQEEKGVDTLGGLPPPQAPPEGRANYTFRHPADVKTDLGLGLGYWVYRTAPAITDKNRKGTS